MNFSVINKQFSTRLPDLAVENDVHVIDAFKALGGGYPYVCINVCMYIDLNDLSAGKMDGSVDPKSRDLFIDDGRPITWPNDGLHPNNKGHTQLARSVSLSTLFSFSFFFLMHTVLYFPHVGQYFGIC